MASEIEKILRMGNVDAPPSQWHAEVDIAWASMGQPEKQTGGTIMCARGADMGDAKTVRQMAKLLLHTVPPVADKAGTAREEPRAAHPENETE